MVYHHVVIDRKTDISLVRAAIRRSRVVTFLGPRQCGKTTLARQFVPEDSVNYFDPEDPQSMARLSEPDLALRRLKGLVVIDEIQRRPELLPSKIQWSQVLSCALSHNPMDSHLPKPPGALCHFTGQCSQPANDREWQQYFP